MMTMNLTWLLLSAANSLLNLALMMVRGYVVSRLNSFQLTNGKLLVLSPRIRVDHAFRAGLSLTIVSASLNVAVFPPALLWRDHNVPAELAAVVNGEAAGASFFHLFSERSTVQRTITPAVWRCHDTSKPIVNL
jgi:hypothetical protein